MMCPLLEFICTEGVFSLFLNILRIISLNVKVQLENMHGDLLLIPGF